LPVDEWLKENNFSGALLKERISAQLKTAVEEKEKRYSSALMRQMERTLLLRLMDQHWKDHLLTLDRLRKGINLRAYAQQDPLNAYKNEAFGLFEGMMSALREEAVCVISRFEISQAFATEDLNETLLPHASNEPQEDFSSLTVSARDNKKKVPRNALCPCGSGLKYKHCHGKL
jgi:preprotein translocase subunit SecA